MSSGPHEPPAVAPWELHIDVAREGRSFVVSPAGEVDLHTAPALRRVLLRAEATWLPHIEIDLAGVSFIDVAGVREINEFRQRVIDVGAKTLELRAGRPAIRRVFALVAAVDLPRLRLGTQRLG